MKIKRITYGILAIVVVIGAIFALMTIADTIAKREKYVRPADYVVPKHQTEYDRKIGPALTPPAADLAFLRSLEPAEFTDKVLRFEFDRNAGNEPASREQIGYTVEKLDLDTLDTSAAYVRPLALGIAGPYVPEKGETLSDSNRYGGRQLPYIYYGLNGELLPKEYLDKMKNIQPEEWVSANNLVLQIVYEVQNLEKPRQVGSAFYDSVTLANLTGSYSSSVFYVSHDLNTYHPAQLRWVVDIAYGPCNYKDIPLEKGQEAIFADAAFRLVTDPFMAYSKSWSRTSSNVKFGFSDSDRKTQNIAVAMSPKCMNHLFTVQFLDKDHKPIGYEKGVFGSSSHIDLVNNYDKEEGKYLRIYHYAGIKRFVLDIGKLPGAPEVNDNVDNLMNVEIPYVYAEDGGMVKGVIRGASQIYVNSSAGYGTKMPQSHYYDITPTELLQEIQKVSPPDSEIRVELENGRVTVGKPSPKITFWQNFKDWMKKIF